MNTEKQVGNKQSTLYGVLMAAGLAVAATLISRIPSLQSVGISPVVLGILLGMAFGNILPSEWTQRLKPGNAFSVKYILRAAIIFYGFRITFQNLQEVGLHGLLVSLAMVVSTLLIGVYLGKKLFKMDTELSILTAAGSAICGAAAVSATESVLHSERHKSVVAISTVVLFGTISMFLFPALYRSGLLHMNPDVFGIFAGGSIHEVAQVVVAGKGVNEIAANNAVIVKMTRVMLLAPVLAALGFFLFRRSRQNGTAKSSKLPIPWFVLGFLAVAGFNSLHLLPATMVEDINIADTFLLTTAMCALGLETHFSRFREAGIKPILLAGILFLWLGVGGYFITTLVMGY